jgi:hypothetical protein
VAACGRTRCSLVCAARMAHRRSQHGRTWGQHQQKQQLGGAAAGGSGSAGAGRLRRLSAVCSRLSRTVARLRRATVRARQGAAPPRPPTVRGRSAKRYPHGTYVPAYRLSAPLTHVRTRVHIDDDRRRTSTHTHTRMHTHRRWSTALSKTPALSKSPASPQGRFGSTTGSETP